jgi:signal transduction histidine kinase
MPIMLNRLRWRLSIMYLLAALSLVSLIGFSTYSLIRHFFQQTTDQALQYKMAGEFMHYGLPLPVELVKVQQEWQKNNPPSVSVIPTTSLVNTGANFGIENEDGSGEYDDEGYAQQSAFNQLSATPVPAAMDGHSLEDQYDASLSAIFVIPLDTQGNPISSTNIVPAPIHEDEAASARALSFGYDWRTIRLADGNRVRLLTYRLDAGGATPAVLQMGRLLIDQDRFLRQFLTGMLLIGGVAALLLAFASWWLAGRSLSPAQKAWDQQQVFVSNASHELRAPLTLLRATAEYALREQTPQEQWTALHDILNECDYMNSLVEDLLLLSRLDNQRLQLAHEVVSLPDLLVETSRLAEKLFLEKKVSLVLDNAAGSVWGDHIRLRQVLLILLDNALRFTPPGGAIHLNTHPRGRMVEISVTDNGRGIATQHLPHLFERFYQVRISGNDNSRSNGLGLSIAKALVEAQDGNIHIHSLLGKGTRVSFSLPTA